MRTFIRLASIAGLCVLVGGCVTYPYTSGFSACDSRAGACYRACEGYGDEQDYSACHADCEYEADHCFDTAYGPYNYTGSPYGRGYASPWYGSYGAWYPESGYAFSFSVIQRYGYRRDRGRYDRDRRYGRDRDDDRYDRDRDDDRRGRDRDGDRDGDRGYRGPGSGGGQGGGSGGSGGSGGGQGGSGSGQGQPPSGGPPPSQPQAAPPPQSAPPPASEEPTPPRRGGSDDRPPRPNQPPVERSPD